MQEVVRLTKGDILALGSGMATLEAYICGLLGEERKLFPTDKNPSPYSNMPVECLESSAAVAEYGKRCDTVFSHGRT
jgi:hypothetical protein